MKRKFYPKASTTTTSDFLPKCGNIFLNMRSLWDGFMKNFKSGVEFGAYPWRQSVWPDYATFEPSFYFNIWSHCMRGSFMCTEDSLDHVKTDLLPAGNDGLPACILLWQNPSSNPWKVYTFFCENFQTKRKWLYCLVHIWDKIYDVGVRFFLFNACEILAVFKYRRLFT